MVSRLTTVLFALAIAATLGVAAPASADFCMQLSGGSFSGDLGFFRFSGKRPKKKGAIVQLKGRVAGLSPVFGTAVVTKDGSGAEFGATFFADAEEGQFDVSFGPPNSTSGSGYASYGVYDVGDAVTANIVSCGGEP
jgi:hypothetical protein